MPSDPVATSAPPAEAACPPDLPDGARCLRGRDARGAHYLIVVPAQWSGTLIVHAHGGQSGCENRPEGGAEFWLKLPTFEA